MKKKKKITKKKIIIAIIIVIIAVLVFSNLNKNKQEETVKPEIVAIEKRNIAKSIGATGVVNSSNTKNVVSTFTGGEISSVNVKKGDKVNVGDVICTFDTSTVQKNLNIAMASQNTSQAQANLGVQSAQRNLNDAIASKDKQVANSQKDINDAKSAYDNAVNQLNNINSALTQKQQELSAYSATYNQNLNSYTSAKSEYDSKQLAVNQAQNALEAKKAEKDALLAVGGDSLQNIGAIETEITNLEATYNTAKSEALNSKSKFDTVNATFTPIKANQDALNGAVTELASQKANLEASIPQLKSAYDKLVTAHNSMISTSDSTIASMRDNVTNSELAVISSSLAGASQINTLKEQIEDGVVKSTVSGTVTNVNVKKGDLYTGSTIATIEGTEQFIIEAEIDEYDIPDVEVGMKVLIKTDATRDEELEGKITYVASSATNSSAVAGMTGTTTTATGTNATYKIEISLDTQNDRLRLGMNAKLSIITEMEEDVWSVPYNAIYEREDGTNYIEIAKDENGENKEEIDVTKGIEGSYYAEIKSDKLKPDMKVILPKVEAGDSMQELLEMMGADAGI